MNNKKIFESGFVNVLKITTFAIRNLESFRPDKRKPDGIPPAGVIFNDQIMYAIVEIAGQQFRVEKDKKLYVQLTNVAEGDSVDIEKVLLIGTDSGVTVGTPTVDGARISVKVIGFQKSKKVLVFKKKRRKTYKKLNGHRQQFVQVQVDNIVG